MSLPTVDFKKIRLHGDQPTAFEELCCQLASDVSEDEDTLFVRKGKGGDGGVECFDVHPDGSETGWQVKFYWDIDSLLSSLKKSLAQALDKHPAMTRFIACFPIALPDSRKVDTVTARTKWNDWRKSSIDNVLAKGRTISIECWDGAELTRKLTADTARSAGRIAYWFDLEHFTTEWFASHFERTAVELGARYDPGMHVDLSLTPAIDALGRDAELFEELVALGDMIAASVVDPEIGAVGERDECAIAIDALHAAGEKRDADAIEYAGVSVASALAAVSTELEKTLKDAGGEDVDTSDVSASVGVLRRVQSQLALQKWDTARRNSVLVTGEAGSGKSHLLASVCKSRLTARKPAIMVLGSQFTDAEPWDQIMRMLDLPRHYQKRHFLGALNAAGQARGCRTIIMIDALNERNGLEVWPERLAGFLHDIDQYPWVAVALSCRTTYLDEIVPERLDDDRLRRVEHSGFSTGVVREYLRRLGLTLPETPLQAKELGNPLFLRTYCNALEIDGSALLAKGLGSVTDIFVAYGEIVAGRVDKTLKVNKRRGVSMKAIDALAREMADRGRAEVPYDRADEIVREFHSADDLDHDLLFQLESEGLLTAEPDRLSKDGSQTVKFTFERIGDHAIARNLLSRSGTSPAELFAESSPLRQAFESPRSFFRAGVAEALAVQLPEKLAIELPDVPDLPSGMSSRSAFQKSLLDRRTDAFSDRTWELIEEVGGGRLRYDILIALGTEPDHPHNVAFLDRELRSKDMASRDAEWSVHFADSQEGALHLVEWARTADQSALADKRAGLTATLLAWFLSTPVRVVRDKATKALVAVLADRSELATKLWSDFKDLDDLYIVERIAAALYGAAMQGRWTASGLGQVAETLRADLFDDGAPPPNVLLRDHAASLIRYAGHRGALGPLFDLASTYPPFNSVWPLETVTDLDLDRFKRLHKNGESYRDEISSSLNDGDFARYIVDSFLRGWSATARGVEPKTREELKAEWLHDFSAQATADESAAFAELSEELAEAVDKPDSGRTAKKSRRLAKAKFLKRVGSAKYEDWRSRAENWRDEGMYQVLPSRGAAGFNLALARRWIDWKAHELGWSEALHGPFDRRRGTGRMSHDIERIGKKYQWIAMFELAARIEDNAAPLGDVVPQGPTDLRDLDPSMLRDKTEDDGWSTRHAGGFWATANPRFDFGTPHEAVAWLRGPDDILDDERTISVTDENGRAWLVLAGFELWASPSEALRCETWRRVGCTVVKRESLAELLQLLESRLLTESHAMPVAESGYRRHLGEHPWAWGAREDDGWIEEWRPSGADWSAPGITVRPPTGEYLAESGSYDHSIEQNIELKLPAGWLMEALDMSLTDGRSIEYRDAAGHLLFMDPSVHRSGRNAALVSKEEFLAMLESSGLVAVWAVAGEKSVFGDAMAGEFGGRLSFTRLYHTNGGDLTRLDRYVEVEKPSREQLAGVLSVEEAELPDDLVSGDYDYLGDLVDGNDR